MKKIILASNSPRRKEILSMLEIEFDVVTKDVDENIEFKNVQELVEKLAIKKAMAVYEDNKDSVVIGGDTVVCLDGKVFGKPKDEQDAFRMIKSLNGKAHNVYSGYSIINNDEIISGYVCTTVEFCLMSEEQISNYISTKECMGKAGAYAIQGKASKFISKIEGCYYNVVGMPINAVYQSLIKCGICK